MNRRQFFKFGFTGIHDAVKLNAPDIIKPAFSTTALDLTILTDDPSKAEALVDEIIREHFGERMLRLKTSVLRGSFPGGAILYQNNVHRNQRDDFSMIALAIRQLESELDLKRMQHDPTLLRYVNMTPPFSRSVEVFHRDRLLLALPLGEDTSVEFQGTLGTMLLRVQHGAFSITSSACTYGTCLAHPPILAPGQRITCLPNEVTSIVGAHFG